MRYDHPHDKLYDALGSPATWPHPHWFRCPNLHIETISRDQYEGDTIIFCGECLWQGYRTMNLRTWWGHFRGYHVAPWWIAWHRVTRIPIIDRVTRRCCGVEWWE